MGKFPQGPSGLQYPTTVCAVTIVAIMEHLLRVYQASYLLRTYLLTCLECSYQSSREVLSPVYRWGSSIFFPCLLSCCLTAQYVECHAKDLVWNLTGEGLILTLLYTYGVLRTFLNLFEPQFVICTTELVISASALSFSVSTLRKALCNHPKESYSHLHSHWISSCFNFVIVFITI